MKSIIFLFYRLSPTSVVLLNLRSSCIDAVSCRQASMCLTFASTRMTRGKCGNTNTRLYDTIGSRLCASFVTSLDLSQPETTCVVALQAEMKVNANMARTSRLIWKEKAHRSLPDSSGPDMAAMHRVLHHQLVSQTEVCPVEQHSFLTYMIVFSS